MKRRSIDPETPDESAKLSLCRALLSLKNVEEMSAFLNDLCTPAEMEEFQAAFQKVMTNAIATGWEPPALRKPRGEDGQVWPMSAGESS